MAIENYWTLARSWAGGISAQNRFAFSLRARGESRARKRGSGTIRHGRRFRGSCEILALSDLRFCSDITPPFMKPGCHLAPHECQVLSCRLR